MTNVDSTLIYLEMLMFLTKSLILSSTTLVHLKDEHQMLSYVSETLIMDQS